MHKCTLKIENIKKYLNVQIYSKDRKYLKKYLNVQIYSEDRKYVKST